MNDEKVINIAQDFSDMPLGRDDLDGPYNGKKFRESLLKNALHQYQKVVVEMDGTLGYGSSFLDEAFGGLVREDDYTAEQLRCKLVVKHKRNSTVDRVWKYIDEAKKAR
ncbi:MAG: STAS-like domain-containing protein [Gammaproteobacteria bacterium]|nr:STAS-like domain-containing protein [Gammaproteobacteria bacterium]